jgi:UDP-glucose 4-epimerase
VHVVVAGGSSQLGTLALVRLVGSRKIKRILTLDSIAPALTSPKLKWTLAHPADPGLERHYEGADAVVCTGFVPPSKRVERSVLAEGSRRAIADAARAGVKRFVYVSSFAAYGVVPEQSFGDGCERLPGPELASQPGSFEVEAALDELEAADPSVSVLRLRAGIPFGRRMDHPFVSLLRRGWLPKLGDRPLPVVWDEDVADALLAGLLGNQRGAFDLVADEPLDSETFAREAALRCFGWPSTWSSRFGRLIERIGLPPAADAWLEATRIEVRLDKSRAERELGFRPQCATAGAVARRFAEQAPRRTDPRIRLFMRLIQGASRRLDPEEIPPEARRFSITLHLALTGRGGGDYTVKIEEGRLNFSRGIPRPPDAVVTLSCETLLEMLTGKLDVATARFAGKVRVQGEPFAGFVIPAMVTGFRRARSLEGARGWTSRKLESWFSRGARP